MRFATLTKGILFSAAFLLPGGALAGGVTPPVLNGTFEFQDANETTNNCSEHEYDGEFFEVDGQVTGVSSNGDTITISYDQDFVDKVSVKSESGSISQKLRSDVTVSIAPAAGSPTPAYTGVASSDKCRIRGRVTKNGSEARVQVTCDVGKDLAGLTPPPGTAELAAIEEAFPKARKDVRLSGKNLQIKQKGTSVVTCP